LRRRAVEQAEIAPAEIVRRLRRFVLRGLFLEPPVSVERVLLALELLLVGELAAGLEHAILGAHVLGVGTGRLGRCG
jgi:hypothetical protein